MATDTLVIIDGHYYAYRFFFGMPGLKGKDGHPTGVSYSFAELFRNLRADQVVTHLVLVMDHEQPSFRHDIFPDYKAHRDPMPTDLRTQLPDVIRLAKVNRVPLLRVPGFEADDVIAILARRAATQGMDVRICTKDKDLDQVLSNRVRTWDPGKNLLRGPAELLAEKGISPDQVIDYLCMIGDSADNVPGIKGVGPKTAAKLLKQYGTLGEIFAHLDDLKGKQRENVAAFLPQAELTRKLITIPDDIPGLPAVTDLVKHPQLDDAARPLYEELGFSAVKHFGHTIPSASAEADYHILTAAALPGLVTSLRAAGRFAIDTETTALDPHVAHLVGISFAWGADCGHRASYLPLAGTEHAEVVSWDQAREVLRPVLEDASIGKVMQNGKFDLQIFAVHGIVVRGYDGDPMLASWVLDPGRSGHGLDYLTRVFLNETKIPTDEVVRLEAGQTMAEVPVATVARYACEDAQCTWRLTQALEAQLDHQGLRDPYRIQELPLAEVLARIELRGMPIDPAILVAKRAHLERYLEEVVKEIHRITGPAFNPASPKQVATFLFDKLGLPVIRKTKQGPSTDAAVLQALRNEHELPHLLLQYRTLTKLLSSYVATLPDFINPVTSRIHTSLRQTGTETGRLASDHPNLQNIPKRGDLGREIRAAFAVAEGRILLAADYSQIELRVLAHLSGDPGLAAAFAAGQDIHRFVAAQVNQCDEVDVTPAMRTAAKAINFGIIYGQTSFGLGQQLGITRTQAQDFKDDYFRRFPLVQSYFEGVVQEATLRGYVETLAGRRRYLPLLTSHNHNERMHGQRTALNSTIQGSAADIIKRAMIRCETMLPSSAMLILQIHDELIVECDTADADTAARCLTNAMTGAWALSVPLQVDLQRGHDWLGVS